MFPLYTSVYDNSWSAMTWTVVFTGFVLYVTILMVAFVSLVHHASEATKPKETQPPARPRLPATGARKRIHRHHKPAHI